MPGSPSDQQAQASLEPFLLGSVLSAMSMDEIQETQLQADIGRAPSEESSGKRRKLENKEVENQEQAILSHAESFQMTIDGYTEEKAQQEKELKEVQQATFQKLSGIQATIEFYSGLLKAFSALKEIPFAKSHAHSAGSAFPFA